MTEFDDLRFGRVIVAGTVIRPDYNWTERIQQGRVEAVLNHCGGKDLAAPFAQYFIPGTGPSARHGFSDAAAINVLSPEYGHSSCFELVELVANLAEGGLWDRFLRRPQEFFDCDPKRFHPKPWHPVWRPICGLVRLIGFGLIAAVAGLVLTLFSTGWLAVLAWWGLRDIGLL